MKEKSMYQNIEDSNFIIVIIEVLTCRRL